MKKIKNTAILILSSLISFSFLGCNEKKEIASNGDINNKSFENNLSDWNLIDGDYSLDGEKTFEGSKSLSIGKEESYSTIINQKIVNLKEGYYYLEAYALNEGNQEYCYIYGQGT